MKTDFNALPEILTITEAAEASGVTRQAIYVAIKKNRIKGKLIKGMWTFTREELLNYQKLKYSREISIWEGAPLFNIEQGEYSVKEAALCCGTTVQNIYYYLRIGRLKAKKRGAAWIIHSDDLRQIYEKAQDSKQIEMEM